LVRESVKNHPYIVALNSETPVQDLAPVATSWPAPTDRPRRHRDLAACRRNGLIIVGVVALAKADAATIGVLAPSLRSALHLSDAQLGLLAALSSATGAMCALPAGGLVDRRRRRTVIAVAVALWSLALGVAGLAAGFAVLAAGRLISGGFATVARPVSVSLTGDLYHPHRRGRALAALDAGQTVGTAVCFLLGALAVRFLSWRCLFWGLAAVGVVLALAARRLDDPVPSRPPGPPLMTVLTVLVRNRTNRVVLAADSISNFFFAGVTSFSVLFITARYGLSNATVDLLAPVIAVGVVAGILSGGRLGDRLTSRAGGGQRLAVAAGCQITAAAIFAAALLSGSFLVAGLLLLLGASVLGGAGPCRDAVRLDIVHPEIRGRAEAAKGLLTLGSTALGPIAFGLLATALTTGERSHAMALRDTFLVMLVPLAAGAVVLLAARRPYAADAAAAGTDPAAGPEPAGPGSGRLELPGSGSAGPGPRLPEPLVADPLVPGPLVPVPVVQLATTAPARAP
jgi:MFS family permease